MLPTQPVCGNSGSGLVSDLNWKEILALAPLENPDRWNFLLCLESSDRFWQQRKCFGFVGAFCFILSWNPELFSAKHPGTLGHSRCDLSLCCLAAPDSSIFLVLPEVRGSELNPTFNILGRNTTNPRGGLGNSPISKIPSGGTRAAVDFVLLEVPPELSIALNSTINTGWELQEQL